MNFRELGRSIEEEMVKASIQKGVSVGLSSIEKLFTGKGSGPSKADGSSGSPFYVIMANKLGGLIGGATGEGIAKPVGTLMKDAGIAGGEGQGEPATGGMFSSLENGFTSIFQDLGKSLGPLMKGIGSIFGGFLEGGGDTERGKAYVVGEKHAEVFVPGSSGHVFSGLDVRPRISRSPGPFCQDGWRSDGVHARSRLISARTGDGGRGVGLVTFRIHRVLRLSPEPQQCKCARWPLPITFTSRRRTPTVSESHRAKLQVRCTGRWRWRMRGVTANQADLVRNSQWQTSTIGWSA